MKRILALLAAFVAMAGCRIEEAEYFDPTGDGFRLFRVVNLHLSDVADDAARVMLFNLYYSASEEEREAIHDCYFYTWRIVEKGDEWHIIDGSRELIIYTDGQSLSAKKGAAWRYKEAHRYYPDEQLPTITCCTDEAVLPVYELLWPDGGGRFWFTASGCSQPQDDGTVHYWCTLELLGAGTCCFYESRTVDYEITEPLRYDSDRPQGFSAGTLTLRAEIDDDELEAEAVYAPSDCSVWIRSGKYEEKYWY